MEHRWYGVQKGGVTDMSLLELTAVELGKKIKDGETTAVEAAKEAL